MAERMDHDKMRRASELPAHEGAATDTLAASGGLELPERKSHAVDVPSKDVVHEPIPGELDPTTEAPTQPGIVGTTGYGADLPSTSAEPSIDDETRKQIRWEGGGRVR